MKVVFIFLLIIDPYDAHLPIFQKKVKQ